MSFRNRLIICMLLISTIPLIFVAYFTYFYSLKTNEAETIKYSIETAQHILDNFDSTVMSLSDSMLNIVSDTKVNTFLRRIDKSLGSMNESENTLLDNELDQVTLKLFTIYSINSGMIKGISIMNDEKKIVSYSGVYEMTNLYNSTKMLSGKYNWVIRTINNQNENTSNRLNIYFSNAILNTFDNKVLGVVVISIDPIYINKIFERTNLENGEYSFILTQNNQIVFHTNSKLIGKNYTEKSVINKMNTQKNGYNIISIEGRKYILTYKTSDQNGWKIVNVIPYSNILNNSVKLTKTIIMVVFISVFSAIIASILLSFSMYKPILRLSRAMNKVDKGSLDIQVDIGNKDEFGMLGISFNKLIQRIKSLVYEVNQQQLMKKEADMIALRAQINPHFLYNTLNVILCLSKSKDMLNIEKATVSLIDLLRISIGSNRDVISIKDEIKYVNSYINIQKLRSDYEFEFIESIDRELYKYGILKFTLQPIIENCIIHGFNKKLNNNIITLKGIVEGENIKIQVADNGCGIEGDNQESLQDKLDNPEQYHFNKVGIINVSERIKLQYGDKYGITIDSYIGEGTKVNIILPLIIIKPDT